jgi:hypothetical protein
MILDNTDGYLESVKAFAERTGQTEKLQEQLDYLGGYACNDGRQTRCLLYRDSSPQSFAFMMQIKRETDPDESYRDWFNGGLLYYGVGEDGVSDPQFSVRLDSSSQGWEVHT